MEMVRVEDAVGMVLGHDLTEIVPGDFKGVAFKKGHIIQKQDVEKLLRIGKEHIYIVKIQEDEMHEDDAACFLGKSIIGEGVYFTEPSEGKINLIAKYSGLLKINREMLYSINDLGDICIATVHGERTIEKDGLIGGCRVIPLIIKEQRMYEAKSILEKESPMIYIKPFKTLKTAIVVTGSEVYKGRIEDKFGTIVEKKIEAFDSKVIHKTIVPDEIEVIKESILKYKEMGAELIVVTGGMSVDPDDKTPGAIKKTGASIVTYGTPILPGAMLLMAYLGDVPVLGLPGCVMFAHTTAFDILLPKIFAGEEILRKDISRMGYGGQCLRCNVCKYPNCHFGKC